MVRNSLLAFFLHWETHKAIGPCQSLPSSIAPDTLSSLMYVMYTATDSQSDILCIWRAFGYVYLTRIQTLYLTCIPTFYLTSGILSGVYILTFYLTYILTSYLRYIDILSGIASYRCSYICVDPHSYSLSNMHLTNVLASEPLTDCELDVALWSGRGEGEEKSKLT